MPKGYVISRVDITDPDVIEFESYDAAQRYFYSEQYQAARKPCEGAAEMEMVLVEGI
jgi:uncharacterized protein (DUF1330 family)